MRASAVVAFGVVLVFATVAFPALALTTVSVGNGAANPDGSYINAQNLADTLASANVTLSADSEVDIVDSIDLSFSTDLNRATVETLTLQAPTVRIEQNVILGLGDIAIQARTLSMNGTVTSAAALVTSTSSRFTTTAMSINVISPSARLVQVLGIAPSGATIQVAPGLYLGNYSIAAPVTLIGDPGLPSVPGPGPNAPQLGQSQIYGAVVSCVATSGITIDGFAFRGNINGVPADTVGNGVNSTDCDHLVVAHDSFNTFTGDNVSLLFGINDVIEDNTFSNVAAGFSTVAANTLTNSTIQDNVIVTATTAAPALGRGALIALSGLLVAVGAYVLRRSSEAKGLGLSN